MPALRRQGGAAPTPHCRASSGPSVFAAASPCQHPPPPTPPAGTGQRFPLRASSRPLYALRKGKSRAPGFALLSLLNPVLLCKCMQYPPRSDLARPEAGPDSIPPSLQLQPRLRSLELLHSEAPGQVLDRVCKMRTVVTAGGCSYTLNQAPLRTNTWHLKTLPASLFLFGFACSFLAWLPACLLLQYSSRVQISRWVVCSDGVISDLIVSCEKNHSQPQSHGLPRPEPRGVLGAHTRRSLRVVISPYQTESVNMIGTAWRAHDARAAS